MRSRRLRRSKSTYPAYWEVYQKCGFCCEQRIVATFNDKHDAAAYIRARPKKAHVIYTVERGW